MRRLLVAVASPVAEHGLWSADGVLEVQEEYLKPTRIVTLQHVGSSQTRARTRVSCIGRRILIH